MLIDAGGTITSERNASGQLKGSTSPERMTRVLGAAGAGIRTRRVFSGLSEQMTATDLLAICRAILDAEDDPTIDGIIVAHGTDTMEETAYFADLSIRCLKPVVFTGAQRAPDAFDYDGFSNLSDAIAAASHSPLARHGVVIAFAGRLIPAACVYKRSTEELDAFRARIDEGAVVGSQVRDPASRKRPEPLPLVGPNPEVLTVSLGVASDARLLEAVIPLRPNALVIQALGRGNAPSTIISAIREASAAGIVIAICSRCPQGSVGPDYETGMKLVEVGAVFAGSLGSTQCRMLLAALFGQGLGAGEVARAFRTHASRWRGDLEADYRYRTGGA